MVVLPRLGLPAKATVICLENISIAPYCNFRGKKRTLLFSYIYALGLCLS